MTSSTFGFFLESSIFPSAADFSFVAFNAQILLYQRKIPTGLDAISA
jgi:hypothetical protein